MDLRRNVADITGYITWPWWGDFPQNKGSKRITGMIFRKGGECKSEAVFKNKQPGKVQIWKQDNLAINKKFWSWHILLFGISIFSVFYLKSIGYSKAILNILIG